MKFKTFVLIMTTLLLTACGDNSSDNTPSPRKVSEATPEDQNTETCTGTDEETIDGSWKTKFTDQAVDYLLTYSFQAGQVTLSNTCQFKDIDLQLTARAQSNYISTNSSLEFLYENSDTEVYNDGSTKADCSVSIPKVTMNYKLKGSCLILESQGKNFVLRK